VLCSFVSSAPLLVLYAAEFWPAAEEADRWVIVVQITGLADIPFSLLNSLTALLLLTSGQQQRKRTGGHDQSVKPAADGTA
jgi:hypothetical protein